MAGGRLANFHNWHNATHPIANSRGAGPKVFGTAFDSLLVSVSNGLGVRGM